MFIITYKFSFLLQVPERVQETILFFFFLKKKINQFKDLQLSIVASVNKMANSCFMLKKDFNLKSLKDLKDCPAMN